jgi:hypothetical protein
MTSVQFRFLLPQLILGFLFSWKFYVANDFTRNYAQWYRRIFWAIFFLLPPNGSLWGYTFFCILRDIPLPYPHMIVTTYLMAFFIDKAVPCAWKIATTDVQRQFWDSAIWLVRVIIVINLGLWVREQRTLSHINNLELVRLKTEQAQLKDHNKSIKAEIVSRNQNFEILRKEKVELLSNIQLLEQEQEGLKQQEAALLRKLGKK